MADTFISYKREDQSWAHRLDHALNAAGLTVWWDASVQAGAQFADTINAEILKASAVLVIWSERSVSSQWVRAEAGEGFNRNILIPGRIDNVSLPLPFSSLHTVDLREADGMARIVRAAQALVGQKKSQATPKEGLIVNGERKAWSFGARHPSILEYISSSGLTPRNIIVELNGRVVSRGDWSETYLSRGDQLEIVQFIGGGAALHAPIAVKATRFKCEGGNGAPRHPAVWYDFGDHQLVQCTLCDLVYQRA